MSKFTDRINMTFAYTPAAKTDIRKTIARELRRLAEEKLQQEESAKAAEVEATIKVRKIKTGAI